MSIIKKIHLNSPKDKRGFSWFPFQDFPQLKNKELLNFHIAELRPGACRGNHYHPNHTEYFLLCGSEIHLIVDDLKGNQEEETFPASPNFLFIIPPKVKHIIENRGSETGYFTGFFEGEGEVESVK